MQVYSVQKIFPAGGGQPFRLSPRRTPPFAGSPSCTWFGWQLPADYNACVQPIDIGFTRGLLLGFLPPALNFSARPPAVDRRFALSSLRARRQPPRRLVPSLRHLQNLNRPYFFCRQSAPCIPIHVRESPFQNANDTPLQYPETRYFSVANPAFFHGQR